PDYLFGDPIFPPALDANGDPLVGVSPAEYSRAEPLRAGELVKIGGVTDPDPIIPEDEVERFHYSPHAGKVFASQEGRISIVWRTRLPIDTTDNSFAVLEQQYNVSASSRLKSRKLFWTEGRYTGPTVAIPEGIVQD